MRVTIAAALLAATAAVLLAGPAFGRKALTHQVNVTITNSSCVLGNKSVSHRNTRIVFSVINNGRVAHGFDIWRFKTKLIKPNEQETLEVKFPGPGAYRYACVAPHSTVKKGVFTIRRS
jgi:uncharacterized cupredoxin-like copper-binding protein